MSTTPLERRPARPVVVTLAVILVYVSAIASIVLGAAILLSRYAVPADEVLLVSLLGVGIILFGLLTLAIASGVARGSRLARILLTVLIVGRGSIQIFTLATTDAWDWSALIDLVIDVLILLAVWTPPAARHFRADVPADVPLIADAPATADEESVRRT